MRFLKQISILLVMVLLLSATGCSLDDDKTTSSVNSISDSVKKPATKTENSIPKITSSDTKMSKYFDISLFDEENYSTVFLGEEFKISASYENQQIPISTNISELEDMGWYMKKGSDYNNDSLIYANESVELNFLTKKGSGIVATFYNSANSSVRLNNCKIVKFKISNGYAKNKSDYAKFYVNGITNTSVVTDIIYTLGTPSHFYKQSENSYYFDYFFIKSDRRNKIRFYIDLVNDNITAVEFASYK